MAKISVIIPTFNDERFLQKCLETLSRQTFIDFELIIVDGHSKDKTVEIAKAYGAKLLYENVGTRGGACNMGAGIASGEILVFTDADAYFPEDWLSKISHEFENDSELAALGGEDIVEDNTDYFEMANYQIDLVRIGKNVDPKKRMRGCNTAYKKSVFLSAGGFNKMLSSIEETELHYRLTEKSNKLKFDPEIFVFHHRRNNITGLFNQFFRNGIGSINSMKVNGKMLNAKYGLPFLTIPALFVWLFFLNANFIYPLLVFVIYISSLIIRAVLILVATKNWHFLPLLIIILATREIAFSMGTLYGSVKTKKPSKKM